MNPSYVTEKGYKLAEQLNPEKARGWTLEHEFKLLFNFPITAGPRTLKNPTSTISWDIVMLLNLT